MRPERAVRGVVTSQRVRVDSLAVRDVLVLRDPHKPSEQLVHRIVHIAIGKSGRILLNAQGDANAVRDPWTFSIRGNSVYRVRRSVPLSDMSPSPVRTAVVSSCPELAPS
jgi:hypothetical protein